VSDRLPRHAGVADDGASGWNSGPNEPKLYAPATSSAAAFGNLTVNDAAQPTARFAPGWSFMQVTAAAASNGTITVTATPIGRTPTTIAGP
jgi:hypothetical protein